MCAILLQLFYRACLVAKHVFRVITSEMAFRPTSCKEAIFYFERESKTKASEASEVDLRFQWPPIKKMDQTLSTLVACEKLSISSNMIDRIIGISGMRNLKVLMIDRNYISSLVDLEAVKDTLEELSISYNCLRKLDGVGLLKRLKCLNISYNFVEDWTELNRLQNCPNLQDLVFSGNPIVESQPDIKTWRTLAADHLRQIVNLDGEPLKQD